MRQFVQMAYIFTLCVAVSAMPPSEDFERERRLDKSYQKWKIVKRLCKDSYSYTVSFISFMGLKSVTEVKVQRGKVIERSYRTIFRGEYVFVEWVENRKNLNTHFEGAPALTMDQLYLSARTVLLKNINHEYEQKVFSLSDDGLLKACYIYDSRIADDITIEGVDIDTLTLAKR